MEIIYKEGFKPPVLGPTNIISNPDEKYEENNRLWQGCPTITVTKGGRLWAGWFSGGDQEPHINNCNLIVYSDDSGKTWSKPVLVIESDPSRYIRAIDIQIWVDPNGRLWVFWVQTRTSSNFIEGDIPASYDDKIHGVWAIFTDNPDAQNPIWSKPKRYDNGFLRNRPTVLSDGCWFMCNYDHNDKRYGYSISSDQGETWVRYYGAKKIVTPFDESMVVERMDGTLWFLARSLITKKYLAQTFSFDKGATWTPVGLSQIKNPSSRFWIGRLKSGNLLLINNQDSKKRINLTALLSVDDGVTWKYSMLLDERFETSYPDVALYSDGRICVIYDYNRNTDKEILISTFTEQDIINGYVSDTNMFKHVISKAPLRAGDVEKVENIRKRVDAWLKTFEESEE